MYKFFNIYDIYDLTTQAQTMQPEHHFWGWALILE